MATDLPHVVLPKGSTLFHGSLGDIEGELRPGGYDKVLWFADTPAIAQLYIPRSGLEVYAGSSSIAKPSQDVEVQAIQRLIGLNYDLDEVVWDGFGRYKSFRIPEGWRDFDLNFGFIEEVERRLEDLGYEGRGRRGFFTYPIHFADGEILPPGGTQAGTLCVATAARDLDLWVKAKGEGDLTDVQYHDVEGFTTACEAGFDGVLIDDFAQSEDWGNLNHFSVGIFGPSIASLHVECVPATYEEWDRNSATQAWPHAGPSYFHRLLRSPNPRRHPGSPEQAANDTLAWTNEATKEDLLEVEHLANQCFTSGHDEPHIVEQAIIDNTDIPEWVVPQLVAYGEHRDWEDLSLSGFRAFVRWNLELKSRLLE